MTEVSFTSIVDLVAAKLLRLILGRAGSHEHEGEGKGVEREVRGEGAVG